jgi:hypothetical protein
MQDTCKPDSAQTHNWNKVFVALTDHGSLRAAASSMLVGLRGAREVQKESVAVLRVTAL